MYSSSTAYTSSVRHVTTPPLWITLLGLGAGLSALTIAIRNYRPHLTHPTPTTHSKADRKHRKATKAQKMATA